MPYVILPSETARLVYGYLVKENLHDIALQFLESSPYLTDCYQVVKNGFQFNTKLMGKELQDLLQEFSVIHINHKVSLICKTSLLYKRIKLKCESLSEILELILFWKYKNVKGNDKSVCDEKNAANFLANVNGKLKSSCESINNKIVNENINGNTLGSEDSCFIDKTNINSLPNSNSNNSILESFQSKVLNESSSKNKDVASEEVENEIHEIQKNLNQNSSPECLPMQVLVEGSEIPDEFNKNSNEKNCAHENEIATNGRNENCTESISNSNGHHMSELCLHSDVLAMDMSSENKELMPNQSTGTPLKDGINFENNTKLDHAEKENQNLALDPFAVSNNSNQQNENVSLKNSSVVFVSSDVGNVAIDQDRNQIIVIPLDYYKSQNAIQNQVGMVNTQKNDFFNSKEITQDKKNEMVFEGITDDVNTCNSVNQLFSEKIIKPLSIDENIMTESDFFGNKELMYNLEKEFTASTTTATETQPVEIQNDNISISTIQTPLILLSQTVVPTKSRFRSILPKKSKVSLPPVVSVQPLLEKKQSLVPLVQNSKENLIQSSGNLDMPSIKTPTLSKEDCEISNSEENDKTLIPKESLDKDKEINEEKENAKKLEAEKTETPMIVTRRNSKRLSLSTPRRKSHIRALEFETPPRKKREKKSRTSPKAQVEPRVLNRRSVRNTLFNSPIFENSLKSPEKSKEVKKNDSQENIKTPGTSLCSLNELSIPIATRSPNSKPSDVWENLTGVGCVIGQSKNSNTNPPKKMWDADLRGFITNNNNTDAYPAAKKKIRKPNKIQKSNRKNLRKKAITAKKPTTLSPSKISLTAKRNTYSINGNEDGSLLPSVLDDLKIVTPFKDNEGIRPIEETPLTKLLRENISTIDVDLSMINTPSFPPTPSIVITPDLEDISLISATNYYSPSKDFSKDQVVKITDYIRVDAEKDKTDTKEMHKKVIDDLVTKAKEIIGIGKENQEDNSLKRRPSGKILSMVKIQMLTQCDKKLCENIPIKEDANFTNSYTNLTNCLRSTTSEEVTKSDLKEELEEKRKRALQKIKVVKENLSQMTKNKVTRRCRKERGSKSDLSCDTSEEKQASFGSDESVRKEIEVFHSTPYDKSKSGNSDIKNESNSKSCDDNLYEIIKEFPKFENDPAKFSGLTEKSKKKLHYVENFLKLDEISKYVRDFNESDPKELFLKPSFRSFFQIFYKWLKHPHKHELNSSTEAKNLFEKYLGDFNKVRAGLNQRNKKIKKSSKMDKEEEGDERVLNSHEEPGTNYETRSHFLSEDDEKMEKIREADKKKDEDTEDGFMSILPLKKRKSTVQQQQQQVAVVTEKKNGKNTENVSQTQNFLQDIDVDRFLSQIHGQGCR
ncbi:Sporulation-specific protein, putative [Pediculus humanus corporis]|uniref:Sporulation-specific protein, putative n=1 Tax=Pediculus humanus subsp. corporis TaxID=121224 RepID=E0VHP4_PEDHC|nr:Sporulation-specific protein, putative [Pediculus humanus corporis]EEB12930.1 Sporulation-specific protein, putative [Pediculus humanus corporis]